jgi:hypothetical protein
LARRRQRRCSAHPSAILRIDDADERHLAREELVRDLAEIGKRLDG